MEGEKTSDEALVFRLILPFFFSFSRENKLFGD